MEWEQLEYRHILFNMNPYVIGNMPDADPRLLRVLRDLADRNNQLAMELESVKKEMPPIGARKEKPLEGIITIPPQSQGGENGFIRVSPDGVIKSYASPAESLFPYMDITVVTNITTGLDQLHTFILPAGTLANNGDALWVRYGGTFAINDNDKRIQTEFDGVATHNSGLFDQDLGTWVYDFLYTRVSPTVIKFPLILHWSFGSRTGGGVLAGNFIFAGDFVGINVSNLNTTSVVLRVMAEGTATNDIAQGLSFISLIKPRTVKQQ